MARTFKGIDLMVQTALYGLMVYMALYEFVIKERGVGAAVFGSMVIGMAPIGIWHGISSLAHAFMAKGWQLLPHRRRYGWLVIGYFVLMPLAFVVFDNYKHLQPISIAVFFSAVPLGGYYVWISWREWNSM